VQAKVRGGSPGGKSHHGSDAVCRRRTRKNVLVSTLNCRSNERTAGDAFCWSDCRNGLRLMTRFAATVDKVRYTNDRCDYRPSMS